MGKGSMKNTRGTSRDAGRITAILSDQKRLMFQDTGAKPQVLCLFYRSLPIVLI